MTCAALTAIAFVAGVLIGRASMRPASIALTSERLDEDSAVL